MSASKLIDVVANLGSLDPKLTIYVAKPWTFDSDAVVAREPDQGGVPEEAESQNAEYFIEVFIATEFLDGWAAAQRRSFSMREQCERLIQYAVHDA
jgi:hypothetical protein